jgi:hypothetical protein
MHTCLCVTACLRAHSVFCSVLTGMSVGDCAAAIIKEGQQAGLTTREFCKRGKCVPILPVVKAAMYDPQYAEQARL